MAYTYKNFAASLVAVAPSPATSGLTLSVTAGDGSLFSNGWAVCWPANEQPTKDNAEIVMITGVSGDTVTMIRNQEGSTNQSISVGWNFDQNITAAFMAQFATTIPYDALVAELNPSAWWKLNDAVGSTTAADSSGNGYTGTVNGQSATLSAALVSGTAYTTLSTTALSSAVSSGANVIIQSGSNTQVFVASAGALVGATSISVVSQNANFSYPIGTLVTGVAFGQPGPISGTPSDTAALFDGSTGGIGGTVSSALASVLNNGDFTFSIALDMTAWHTASGYQLIQKFGATTNINTIVGLYLSTTGLYFSFYGDDWATGISPASGWHLISFTFNHSTKTGSLYVDGLFIGSNIFASVPLIGSGTAWQIATNDTSATYFSGTASQSFVLPTALTAAQVADLYNAAPKFGSINQLTGDVTAGPGAGSQSATLNSTANVDAVIAASSAVVNITPVLVRRSATATAGIAEATEFTGSTAGQTITAPVAPPASTIWRFVNDSSVTVTIAGGTNSLNIGGSIVASYVVAVGQALDFIYDSTGIWTEMGGVNGPVTNLNGVIVSGTPSAGQVLTATSSTAADWGAGGGGLSYVESYITANVSLSASTPTNITSVSLTAGTWLITARALLSNSSATASANFDIWIGPTAGSLTGAYAGQGGVLGDTVAGGTSVASVTLVKIVVLASTTTVNLITEMNQAGTVLYGGSAVTIGNESGITAVKIA